MNSQIHESLENDKILSEVFADRVKVAREELYPSAESLVEQIPLRRIIVK